MRYVIAIDKSGIYLRKTLCVTHDGISGEVRYDTVPLKRTPAGMVKIMQAVKREYFKDRRNE